MAVNQEMSILKILISLLFVSLLLSSNLPIEYDIMYINGNLHYCNDEGVCNFSTHSFEITTNNNVFEILMNDSLIEYNASNKKILPLINLFENAMIRYFDNCSLDDTIIVINKDTLEFKNSVLTRIVYYRDNSLFVFNVDSFSINIR
ncbi:hypothetical protein KAU15_02820 [candidate division WOR-3 bacterium]|nr:hypothetical protein [candidate division WOR-3 bacterium]